VLVEFSTAEQQPLKRIITLLRIPHDTDNLAENPLPFTDICRSFSVPIAV
jgi:hypothetical protein